jgi:hypothetical protein
LLRQRKVTKRKATRRLTADLKYKTALSIPYLIRIPAVNTKKSSLIFSLGSFLFQAINSGDYHAAIYACPKTA